MTQTYFFSLGARNTQQSSGEILDCSSGADMLSLADPQFTPPQLEAEPGCIPGSWYPWNHFKCFYDLHSGTSSRAVLCRIGQKGPTAALILNASQDLSVCPIQNGQWDRNFCDPRVKENVFQRRSWFCSKKKKIKKATEELNAPIFSSWMVKVIGNRSEVLTES